MIRELRIEDKALFISMVKDFYESEAVLHNIPIENTINTFNEINSSSPYIKGYLMEDQGEAAGYGLVSFTYSNEANGLVVLIEELYIRENFRGLGFGGKFIDFIIMEFSSQAKRFRLELSKKNKSAEKLYLRKGFIPLEYNQMIYDL
ncbi:GNAT family N-acetyltransferase [Alkaliphilus peptidifermentans]|uniref:Acetyltransferase (GNAT) family protein n=1 Tax=Alkaliphilus peptidifermentans DSM 18978 TaxID=1120976 RepID=A0A1G5CCM2_9FIRM|nr:GNAT family N-acetyltransferase [Alkaliphilus peptidifermentans]SCY00106.1 Acetyltransferase (GNAT) family protein [Alkaliphilus peptidifermentans DSM 18978]